MVKLLKDIGYTEDEDEPRPKAKKPKRQHVVADDEEEVSASKKPTTEIVAPEFEGSKLHSGQLEFLTLIRVISDRDLQSRLWPRLTEDHFASDTARAVFTRLRTLQIAGKEWPKLGVLAHDPALPKSAQAQLVAFVAKAETGTLSPEVDIGNGQKVAVSRPEDFEGHVYDIIDSYRVIRKSWESFIEVTDKIADEGQLDPLAVPEMFERAASEILNLRGKEAIADSLLHFGYGLSDTDNRKRQTEMRKVFAKDRPRFKTGFATYDEKAGGFQPGEVVLLGAGTGGGKCITGDSLVITNNGLLSMEELAGGLPVGYTEAVFEIHGRNGREPTSHLYKEVVNKTIKINTALGFSNRATAAHRVLVVRDGVVDWRFQKDLVPGDAVVVISGQRLWGSNTQLPSVAGVNTLPTMSLGLAKVLGYLISEGHFNKKFSFSNYDQEVMDDYIKTFRTVFPDEVVRDDEVLDDGRVVGVRHSIRPQLVGWLESIGLKRGLSDDRSVPRCIRSAPEQFVVAFLQALFEGDGYIQQDNKKQVFYTTTSEELHRQVKLLLLNLGIVTNTIEQYKSATNGTPGNISRAYTLVIGHKYVDVFAERIGFLSSRKKAELVACINRGQRHSVGRKTEYLHGADTAMQIVWAAIRQAMSASKMSLTKLPGGHGASGCVRLAVSRKKPTKISAKRLLQFADHLAVAGTEVDTLRFLTRDDVVCDLITSASVVDDTVTVYDFVVPGTHSFCANGLVQHNTAFALSLMNHMARMGTSVAMLQLELTTQQISERISANLADVDSDLVRTNKLSLAQQKKVAAAWEDFHEELKTSKSRFTVFTPSSSTVQECEYVFKTFPYKVWFIDYINLLKWEGGGKERSGEDWTRLSDIVKAFKALAKKYGIAIVLNVQVNVDKETGDIEIRYAKAMKEHADVVLVWDLTLDAKKDGVVWLRHLKARQYDTFDFPVRVALNYCRFESVNMAIQPKTEERKLGGKKKIKKDEDDAPPADNTFKKKEKPLVDNSSKRAVDHDDDVTDLIASANRRAPIHIENDAYEDLDE